VRDRVARLWRVPPTLIRWATVAMCIVALAEAAIIARLLLARSAAAATVDAKAAIPPARVEILPIEPPPQATPIVVTTAAVDPTLPEIQAVVPPAAPVRTGAFRVSAPIELHVLDGERVVGSSVDGPIVAPAGRREFEFVNSTIGYRVRQMVDVKAGQITPLVVPVPNGTLNINAQPWAAVWLDGASIGETPLGNLSVVPGEHEILFRHPELGERRERTIVRAGVETRVAVNLQR
jgi:serine/threonine-protein kinase